MQSFGQFDGPDLDALEALLVDMEASPARV
jgi:hypothetical protein